MTYRQLKLYVKELKEQLRTQVHSVHTSDEDVAELKVQLEKMQEQCSVRLHSVELLSLLITH